MEKRFEAIDNDYLSIPDTDDFSFSKGDLFLRIEFDGYDSATVETIKDIDKFRKEIERVFLIPQSILAGSRG